MFVYRLRRKNMKYKFSHEGEAFFRKIVRDLLEGHEHVAQGSVRLEDALARGAVLGEARYAAMTPHHVRSEYGAWTYQNTYFASAEAAYTTLFEGPVRGITISDVWVMMYPAKTYLMASADHMICLPETGYLLEMDGVDDWNDRESPLHCYSAQITRTDDPADKPVASIEEWNQWANEYFRHTR